jgi:integrase
MNAKKNSVNDVLDDFISKIKSSNPSDSTHKTQFLNMSVAFYDDATDKILTNLNFRSCKLYDGSSKTGHADLSVEWFVYFSYRHPQTYKMERFKVFKDLNKFNTLQERKDYAKLIINSINSLLRMGYNPYQEFEHGPQRIDKNILKCAEFYLSEKKHSVAHKTFRAYKGHISFFTKWIEASKLAHLKIGEINKGHIRQFLADYRDKSGVAGNRQLNNIKDNVGLMFSYYLKNFDDILDKNPITGLTNLPYITQGNLAYSESQVNTLKELMSDHNPSLLLFCETIYETCCRPHEEARKLIIDDFEFEQNRLRIRPELSKSGRNEWIPLSDKFCAKIKQHIKGYPKEYYLFGKGLTPGTDPEKEWTINRAYRKIKKLAGMDGSYTIYSWKHTYCTRAYIDTKDVYYIQTKCRHTDLAVTCKYLRNLGLFVDLKKLADKVREL